MRLVLGLATASSLLAAPSTADACSAYACGNGVLSPFEDGTVPKNLPGIFWRPMGSFNSGEASDPTKVVLATTTDSTPLPFTSTALADGSYVLVPTNPLVEGTHYTVTDTNMCEYGSQAAPTAGFVAGPEQPLPTVLGGITKTSDTIETFEIATYSGSCSSEVTAHRVKFTSDFILEARAWIHLFHFQTYVDGQPWTRTESAPVPASLQGTWYVYRTCQTDDQGTSPGLSVGPHEVKVKATIPGTTVELWSTPLMVELYCPGEKDEDGDNVPDVTDEEDTGCHVGGGAASPWLLLLALGYTARRKRQR